MSQNIIKLYFDKKVKGRLILKTRRKLEFSDGHILDNVANGAGNGSIISSWVTDEDDGKRYDYEGYIVPIVGTVIGKKWFEIKDPATGDIVYEGNYMPEAKAQEAFAFGKGAKALGIRSLAIGTAAIANEQGAIAIGQSVMSSAQASFATGNLTVASGPQAMATGYNNIAKGDRSFTSGHSNVAYSNWSAIFGVRNHTGVDVTFDDKGRITKVTSLGKEGAAAATFITGVDNESTSYAGLTSGTDNHNKSEKSFVIGYNNTNTGGCSITAGKNNTNASENGLTLGNGNTNTGSGSVVTGGGPGEGFSNSSKGINSAIIGGVMNKILSTDGGNFIAGGLSNTVNSGISNFLANAGNDVYGSYKALVGYYNVSTNNDLPQFICGKYNEQNSTALFMVGMGDDPLISGNKRRNALEVLVNGSINSGGDTIRLNGIRSAIIGGNSNRVGTEVDDLLADNTTPSTAAISVDYSSIVGGKQNKIISGVHCFATGRNNLVDKGPSGDGDSNFVANAGNYVYGSYKAVFGTANTTSKDSTPQLVCGNLSKANSQALFMVGDGVSPTRMNAFEVLRGRNLNSGDNTKKLNGSRSAVIGGTGNQIGTDTATATDYNFIAAGESNTVYNGTRNFVANAGNYVYGSYKSVVGKANKTWDDSKPQFICGVMNSEKEDALFIVGNGDEATGSSTGVRKNALEVYKDGKTVVNKKPETDNEVVRLCDLKDSSIAPVIELDGYVLIIKT